MRIGREATIGALLSLAGYGAAYAEVELEQARQLADRMDTGLAAMRADLEEVKSGYGITLQTEVGKVERRLREGEIHFLLEDYLRAAIVLLDVVESEEHRTHPKYDESVFLLAEALRKSRNYAGARRYYEQLLTDATGDRLEDVVLGLLQIAGETSDYEDVDRHVARLRQAGTLSRPDVDYIYGKMLFKGGVEDPGKMRRAYEVFSKIPEGSSVSARAAYYAGVTLVQLGRYQEAVDQFRTALSRLGEGEQNAPLRELTYLSLGRLHQELGNITESADAYQEISQDSPYFSDMLFEVAWAHVTAANQTEDADEQRRAFTRALRAVELLMATAPDSRLYPKARILQGNLQIRLGAPETAYDTFQDVVDEYGGVRDKVQQMVRDQSDAKAFFRELLAADLAEVEAQGILPPLAVTWALEEDSMERAVGMERDLTESERFMAESRELVDTLQAALSGEQRFNMFPGLEEARSKAMSIENRVLDSRRRLLELERDIIAPRLAAAQASRVQEVRAEAEAIEQEISQLPRTDAAVEERRREIREAYLDAGRRAHLLRPKVSNMRAQVVAVELWLRDNRSRLSDEELALMEERLVRARAAQAALSEELTELERDIRQAADVVGGSAGRGRAKRLAERYQDLQKRELELLSAHRGQAPAELQGVLQRIDQQRTALESVEGELEDLQAKLEGRVRDRVDEMRHSIAEEVARLDRYESEHDALSRQTRAILGPVADRTLAAVGRQFRDLVLEADVGIIDVAWARKRAETEKVNELIREQQRRQQELEAEFSDFLRE